MSKARKATQVDYVQSEIYNKHLSPDSLRFASDPSKGRHALIERMLVKQFTELSMNRFKWEGLPEGVDVRFMEMQLFYRGLVVFFQDIDRMSELDPDKIIPGSNGYFAAGGSMSGAPNLYGNPTSFYVEGANFLNFTMSARDCVPIWSNYLRVPDIDIVMIYAHKIATLDRTLEINAMNARRSKVIVADENLRLSATNINRMIDEGQPVIQVKSAIGEMVTAIDLGIDPDSLISLSMLRSRFWNECMTLLGINNSNQDKKERLVSDEVDANNDQVDSARAVNLNARQIAVDQINKKYGLNVTVGYHTDPVPVEPEQDDEEDKDKPDA